MPKQETTYRRPKRQTEATAWRHSLSDIARPYDKIRNNDINITEKKIRRSEAENMKRNQDVPISEREIGGANHHELQRSVPWAKTTNCSHREEATAVTERTVDYE